jgi:hypothetical protein
MGVEKVIISAIWGLYVRDNQLKVNKQAKFQVQ